MSIEDQPRSVSQTEQYLNKCAWQYWLQRVERVEPRPAAWSAHGTAFHSAAEAFERSGRLMDPEGVSEVFSDQYSALINKSLDKWPDTDEWLSAGPYTGGQDIERRYTLGLEQTARYVVWSVENEPAIWKTPEGEDGLELYFMVELGGIKVRGYIDQLIQMDTGRVRVRDLKTGTTKSKFQLHTYAVAVEQQWGVEVDGGDWYLAKNGGLSRKVKRDGMTVEEIGQKFADMDAGVKRGDFPARPGYDCRFCDVSHACIFFSRKS